MPMLISILGALYTVTAPEKGTTSSFQISLIRKGMRINYGPAQFALDGKHLQKIVRPPLPLVCALALLPVISLRTGGASGLSIAGAN